MKLKQKVAKRKQKVMKRNEKQRKGQRNMPILKTSNGTETKNSEKDKKSQNGTKSDETEQKVAKQTSLYGNKNKK